MYKLLAKKGQLFAVGVGALVVAIYLGTVIIGIGNSGYSLSDDLNQIMKANPDQTFDFFNIGLALTLIMIVICAVIAVVFGIVQLFSAPKSSLKAIISVVALIAIFVGVTSMSGTDMDSPIGDTLLKFDISERISKLISGGLGSGLLLGIVAICAMIIMETLNFFK